MPWDKLKSLFVVRSSSAPAAGSAGAEGLELAGASLDAFQVAKDQDLGAPPPLATDAVSAGGGAAIEFQALYDQAGIPNTDEVEALEKFLGGLDMDLPQASKVAAAKAFLGAIGKAPGDVLEDAGRKIQVVRVVEQAKREATEKAVAERQAQIDALQKQIEDHRTAMETVHRELESVRSQCAVEEARLQGARTFFGHAGQVPPPGPPMVGGAAGRGGK
jgi:hypothetical protein